MKFKIIGSILFFVMELVGRKIGRQWMPMNPHDLWSHLARHYSQAALESFMLKNMKNPQGGNSNAHLPNAMPKKRFICTSGEDRILTRSFYLNKKKHWPGGVVPYEMDPTFTQNQWKVIQENFDLIQRETNGCVRWMPRNGQEDFVKIVHFNIPEVCSSAVGVVGGEQYLNLSDDCFDANNGFQGAILHEMMHTLGFIHEQQRLDRDCYVKVAYKATVFQEIDYGITQRTSTAFPYDFKSIMHYGTNPSMESLNGTVVGNEDGKFTQLDKMKLNNMYCGGSTFCQVNRKDCLRLQKAQNACKRKTVRRVKKGKRRFRN